MQHDISVPVEKMPEFILAAAPAIEAAFPGTRAVAFGHLGGCDRAASTGSIFDHHRLTQGGNQTFAQEARHDIRRRTGRSTHNDTYGFVWPGRGSNWGHGRLHNPM